MTAALPATVPQAKVEVIQTETEGRRRTQRVAPHQRRRGLRDGREGRLEGDRRPDDAAVCTTTRRRHASNAAYNDVRVLSRTSAAQRPLDRVAVGRGVLHRPRRSTDPISRVTDAQKAAIAAQASTTTGSTTCRRSRIVDREQVRPAVAERRAGCACSTAATAAPSRRTADDQRRRRSSQQPPAASTPAADAAAAPADARRRREPAGAPIAPSRRRRQWPVTRSAIGIGLMGLGVVGSGVARILQEKADVYARQIGCPLELRRVLVRDVAKQRDCRHRRVRCSRPTPRDLLDDPEIEMIIEVMGGEEPAYAYLRDALVCRASSSSRRTRK